MPGLEESFRRSWSWVLIRSRDSFHEWYVYFILWIVEMLTIGSAYGIQTSNESRNLSNKKLQEKERYLRRETRVKR